MKRMMYLLALSIPMSMCAQMRDLRKYNLVSAIEKWVEQAKKDGTYDELPQVIKDAGQKIEKKDYLVARNDLSKITEAVFQHALKTPVHQEDVTE